jgi:TPR repeat protein
MYEIALLRIDGSDRSGLFSQDIDKGLQDMRDAATLGSPQAQYYLGNRYGKGDERMPRELDRARRYFRLCAGQGVAVCQFRLGLLLYQDPNRRERDYLQSIALFQLAAAQGLDEAKPLADTETPKLTAEQSNWVATLKKQIVRN